MSGYFGFFGFGALFLPFIILMIIALAGSRSDEDEKFKNLKDENVKLKSQVSAYEKILGDKSKTVPVSVKETSWQTSKDEYGPSPIKSVTPAIDKTVPSFCIDCGFPVPSTAQFCPNCGRKVRYE